jgi:hypothetical protein
MTRQNSPYRLDKDKVIIPEDDSLLAVIPLSARNIILSACEYFNWRAFWSVNPPDDQEWDNIQFILAELEQSMATAISVQLIDQRLIDIKTAIEEIQIGGGDIDCSCFEALIPIIAGGSLPPHEPADWDDPANAGLWDYPTAPTQGATDFEIAACRLAKHLVLAMATTLEKLAPVANTGASGAFVAAPLFLLAVPVVGWAIGVSAATAIGMWGGLLTVGSNTLNSQAAKLREEADDIGCLWDGVTLDSKASIRAMLVDLKSAYGFPANLIAATMYNENLVNKLAETNVNAWPGDDCNCPPEEVTLTRVWSFADTGMGDGWSFVNSPGTNVPWHAITGAVRVRGRECSFGCAIATSKPFVVTGNVDVHVATQFLTSMNLGGRVETRLQIKSGTTWQDTGMYYTLTTSDNITVWRTITAQKIALTTNNVYRMRLRVYPAQSGYYREGQIARVRIA